MPYARIQNGVVIEILPIAEGQPLSDILHPDIVKSCQPCSTAVREGWLWSEANGFTAPAPTPPLSGDVLRAYAAARRLAVETGGVDVAGSRISTDRESQMLINGAHALCQVEPTTVIRFKVASGFVQMDAVTMQTVAVTVAKHVQACFAKEADISAAIEAGTITTIAEIDAAFV